MSRKASRLIREEIDLVPHESPAEPAAGFKPEDRISQHPDTVQQGLPRSLAQEEASALRRISPRRNRWPELADIDQRVASLEQRAKTASDELQRLRQERNTAPERDVRTHADWIAGGERGRKPEPSVPELDRRIEEAERERDALRRAMDDVLEDKARFVEKHRKRLVRDADAQTGRDRKRIEGLIDELASAREEMVESRHAAVWAATFPSRAASASPPTTVAGGVRRVLERANIGGQVEAERIYELLREDARYLERVLTEEQAKAQDLRRPDEAMWEGTPEAQEAQCREQEQARQRYVELWGQPPSEFGL